jgi:MSHA biogenesis protein MshQ
VSGLVIWPGVIEAKKDPTSYSLPADFGSDAFSGCGGAYACAGNLTIGNNITVTLTADVTLNVSGAFSIGNGVVIDANGFAFTLNVSGDVDIGNNSEIEMTVTAAGNIDIGNGTDLTGDVTAAGDLDIKPTGSVDGICTPSHPNCSGGGVPPPVVDAGGFNCVATGAAPVTGHLYLQKVGAAFAIDVVALNEGLDGIQTAFASDADRSVTVELVDASSGAACASLPALSPAVSRGLVFSAANAGRVSTMLTVDRAYRNLRCRVTDAFADPTVTACSGDRFAVRPEALVLTASELTNATSGGSPAAAAGSAFSLQVDGGAGYDGTPAIDTGLVEAHAGALRIGTLNGAFPAADPSTGRSVADAFRYDEVGRFRLQPQGVFDNGFTVVDRANGDCTDDFANTPVGGRYGCHFGNTTASDWVGRFFPAAFSIGVHSDGALDPTCGTFAYQGQPVDLVDPVVFRITALAAGGTTTRNYTGDHAHLDTGDVTFAAIDGDADQTGADGAAPVSLAWTTAGSLTLTDLGQDDPALGGQHDLVLSGAAFTWGAEPPAQRLDNDLVAPFTTALDVAIESLVEADGGAATGLPVAARPTGVEMRNGRLAVANAHGSELQHLPVPARVEVYDGVGSGFVVASDDSCSTITAVSLVDLNTSDGLVPAETCVWDADNDSLVGCAGTSPAGMEFEPVPVAGDFGLVLAAPGAGNTGVLGIGLSAPAHLRYDWSGAGDSDPTGRATFGIFNRTTSIIYQREVR